MRHDEGFFSAHDNLRLFWRSELPDGEPKAHVIVVHGYQDHVGRYVGVFQSLTDAGFAAHAYDFRGHGQSDGKRGHCDRFQQFVDDLDLFIQRVQRQAAGKKVFLLAHSHGALTALHWLKQKGANGIAGVVMSAPYLKLAFKPPVFKVLGAKLAGNIIPWLPVPSGLPLESLSRDVAVQKAAGEDPLYNENATPRWFNEANRAQLQAMTFGPSIEVPLFLFFGADDQVAATGAARQLFDTIASQDKRLKEYPQMRHEAMNELGKEEVHADLVGWISSRV